MNDSEDLKLIVDKYREYVMGKANLAEVLQVVNMASMKRILKTTETQSSISNVETSTSPQIQNGVERHE